MRAFIFKFCVLATLFITSVTFGQGYNKKSLTADLNSTNGVSLSAAEKSSYEKANNEFIAGVADLDKKNLSQAERDKEIDKLFDKRDKSLEKSMGGKYKDIKKSTEKSMRSTKRKIKLAKLVL